MKLYRGTRRRGGNAYVTVTEPGFRRTLALRYGNGAGQVLHSPTGFEWGYCGSGPAQLAFALCYDVLESAELAKRIYQDFKRDVIEILDQRQDWSLTEAEIQLKCDALIEAARIRRAS